jgi:hypothetical protein
VDSAGVGVVISVDGIVDPGLPCGQSSNTPASPLYGESLESEDFWFDNDAEKRDIIFIISIHMAFPTCSG